MSSALLVSKTPYQMTPTELEELKTQLQELLDKRFHLTQCITMGSTSVIRKEERWIDADVCGLSPIAPSDS